ncbi:hypothetical protein NM208_g2647 [Fusarium decemcellulare]|uniref:Uncharacterized protein n=1 Tax=Fusarium decemcellulare TaxID=57161 RepID=A0ACC1SRW7_9HYPO|nr:hypothetical protein NM208_g2647 [Fusarium decemcellulare]
MASEETIHRTEERSAHSTVAKTILDRHSTRAFCTGREVPLEVIKECLSIAQYAPSSTNIQPWRITMVSGPPLRRLSDALISAFDNKTQLQIPPIPESYHRYRSELGHHVYGPNGYNIPRGDTEAMTKTLISNFKFYNAPFVAVVCIDKELNNSDILSVGIYLQTLLLLLTERGLGTQISVAPTGYPDIIKQELEIGENMDILCTVGIGYENKQEQINSLKMPRDDWKENVRFIAE